MKFKVGDKVRLTREAIAIENKRYRPPHREAVLWWVINKIKGGKCYYWVDSYLEEALELVPEEPEFEEGEMIEVSDDWKEWERRIFLYYIPNVPDKYLCVHKNYEGVYLQGWDRYDYQAWLYARKLKPQLTRKEIAEKFWVSEDFTLID